MAIGSGIFLIAVGAILTFALNESVEAINLGLVGWILMGAGALGIIISLVVNGQRRNTTHTEVKEQHVDSREHIDSQQNPPAAR
ncbi:DUF6458 family protein [Demequina sp. B12]|uniref:DUF6458 family protein n=1 Tax=Demequina sp. B12 TaxID=2992757 RepID=UPI00237A2292|nr:DUF6458 family protein [Demequina sp. B12]MDE0572196.1 DUF6458 family protein [Demequina sp. B12]